MNVDELAPARGHIAAAVATLVAGAGWIHLLAAEDHQAHTHVAAFFFVAAVLQLGWAACVLYKVTGGLLVTGVVGNLGLALLWVISRTTGVPVVPGVGQVEPVGIPDAAASGLELIAVAALGVLLATRTRDLAVPRPHLLVAGAASLALPLVLAAGAMGAPHHHDDVSGVHHAAR